MRLAFYQHLHARCEDGRMIQTDPIRAPLQWETLVKGSHMFAYKAENLLHCHPSLGEAIHMLLISNGIYQLKSNTEDFVTLIQNVS